MKEGERIGAEEYDDDLEEGGSEVEVTGAAQSLDDLTIEDYMALAPKEGRESFMLTRFPVEMDEFRKMSAEAEELESDEAALEVDTLSDDGPDEDADPLVVDTESEIDAMFDRFGAALDDLKDWVAREKEAA